MFICEKERKKKEREKGKREKKRERCCRVNKLLGTASKNNNNKKGVNYINIYKFSRRK